MGSEEIKDFCQQTKGLELTEEIYQEFGAEATEAKDNFLHKAREVYNRTKEHEEQAEQREVETARLAQEREEIEKEKAALAELDRVERAKLDAERKELGWRGAPSDWTRARSPKTKAGRGRYSRAK